jgi:Flagellar hook capping protein - N-terminal region/FlgD Tudor-like domain
MTQIFPISTAQTSQQASAPKTPDQQFGQDTFLKLLVAQLKYQDPLAPTDGTQFLTQTAQFTTLETLQKIEKQQESLSQSSQLLSASSMVGRAVTYSLTAGGKNPGPTATTNVALRCVLSKDAPAGTHVTTDTDVFTRTGTKVPVSFNFTKTADGWTMQASSGGANIGGPTLVQFDAAGDHAVNDITITASDLNTINGTSGTWGTNGLTVGFGTSADPTRLQLAAGNSNLAVLGQNGNDGNTTIGLVTGIHMTSDGPQLVIGGQDIPLSSVTDVQA